MIPLQKGQLRGLYRKSTLILFAGATEFVVQPFNGSTEKTAISKKGEIPQKSKKIKGINIFRTKNKCYPLRFPKNSEKMTLFLKSEGNPSPFYRLMPHDSTTTVVYCCFFACFDTADAIVSSYSQWH